MFVFPRIDYNVYFYSVKALVSRKMNNLWTIYDKYVLNKQINGQGQGRSRRRETEGQLVSGMSTLHYS